MDKLKYELNPKNGKIAIKGGRYVVSSRTAIIGFNYQESDSVRYVRNFHDISCRPVLKTESK